MCVISVLRLVENFSGYAAADPTKSYVLMSCRLFMGREETIISYIRCSGLLTRLSRLLEVNVGTTCACLPFMKPFLQRFIPKLLGEEDNTYPPITRESVQESSAPDTLNSMVEVADRVPLATGFGRHGNTSSTTAQLTMLWSSTTPAMVDWSSHSEVQKQKTSKRNLKNHGATNSLIRLIMIRQQKKILEGYWMSS